MIDRVIDLSGKTENGNYIEDILTYTGFVNNRKEFLHEGDEVYFEKKVWKFYGIVEFNYKLGFYVMTFTKKENMNTGEIVDLRFHTKNNYLPFIEVDNKYDFKINLYLQMYLNK